jgi:predicted DNA-binding transcriptional regulator AlpA
MSQTSTTKRARRVIRRNLLGQYLGVSRSTVDELVARGELHLFSPMGAGGRAKVAFEDEVAELQDKMVRAARKEKK